MTLKFDFVPGLHEVSIVCVLCVFNSLFIYKENFLGTNLELYIIK